MGLKSIRWQLPLSYAAIALISTLSLGLLLLINLGGYYEMREEHYMEHNANAINRTIADMIAADTPMEIVEAQIASYAFLSQVRIQVFDDHGQVLVDSGLPDGRNLLTISTRSQLEVEAGYSPVSSPSNPELARLLPHDYADIESYRASIEMPVGIAIGGLDESAATEYYTPVINLDFVRIYPEGEEPYYPEARRGVGSDDSYSQSLSATGTLYGFGLNDDVSPTAERSKQVIQQPLLTQRRQKMGTLRLSDGPAYGTQIVDRVGTGLMLASMLAFSLGAAGGWVVSRRITAPLSALTETTTAMAQGQFSVRAAINRGDELGLLARTFNDMASQIENTVVTLRRFVADAAHELHTPLTALRTSVELATDETNVDAHQAYLDRARKQIARLQALTDGLLDLSRLEAGVAETHKAVRLNRLVQEISELYASRSEVAQVNFTLDLPQEDVYVDGSERQLRSAISNLMDNAIKFTPCGGTVSVAMTVQPDRVELRVQDGGIGIPEEEMPLIFGRFHRCRNAVTYGGSGLGLAIVHGVVDSHHGAISVQNTHPGALFTVQLPLGGAA